ncbi:hypothetical protein ABES03_10190 [Neobacillus rhizosphaerae]|uniref:hypothetical protein n=1 Tax=Neobacillus rhizosphaerae TaxID=2880965 RepID=UPI003D2A7A27
MDELIETINLTLEKLGIKNELVEPKIMEYLKKMEAVLSEKLAKQEVIQNEITKNRPSINGIAKESKVARQTIYNNNLLKNYTQLRMDNYNQQDPVKRNEKLSEDISKLEKRIKQMGERDVQIELMRRKVSLVEKELKHLKEEKEELQQRYNNVRRKIVSGENNIQKAEVIPIIK